MWWLRLPRRFQWAVSLGIASGLLLASCAEGSTVPPFEQLFEEYEALAFGAEYDIYDDLPTVFMKRDPAHVAVVVPFPRSSSFRYELFSTIAAVVDDINDHSTGVKVTTLDARSAASYVTNGGAEDIEANDTIIVNVGSRDEIRRSVLETSANDPRLLALYQHVLEMATAAGVLQVCLTVSGTPKEGSAVLGRAVIWIEDGPLLEACLYEEILQSFGLFNDFGYDLDSIFSDVNHVTRPSELDWCLWALHSHASIEPGMTGDEARPVARKIYERHC
jgi:hypothetical protein